MGLSFLLQLYLQTHFRCKIYLLMMIDFYQSQNYIPAHLLYLNFLSEQGPIGWQSLADSENEELSMLRDIYYIVNSSGHSQISATSWEAAVQKHIEEELYASSLEVISPCL